METASRKRRLAARSFAAASSFGKSIAHDFRSLWRDLSGNRLLDSSAEMAYHTLVSVVPFFITIFPFLNVFGVFGRLKYDVGNFLTGIIGADNAATLLGVIGSYIERGSGLGIYGFIIFSFTSSLLVERINVLFARVYRINTLDIRQKNIISRLFGYMIYIIAFALCLSTICFIRSYIYSRRSIFGFSMGTLGSFLLKRAAFMLFVFLMAFVLFMKMPRVYANPWSVFLGSVFFVLEYAALNWVMGILLKYFFSMKSYIYGTLAALIFSLMWLNFFWKIVIAAMDFAYIDQYNPEFLEKNETPVSVKLQNGIDVMYLIVDGFKGGRHGARLDFISSALSISGQEAIEICDKFQKAGLIHAVGPLGSRLYVPALPVGEIKVYYVISALKGEPLPDRKSSRVLEDMRRMEVGEFLDLSVEDL